MADHTIEIIHSTKRDPLRPYMAQCKCGQNSMWVVSRSEAEEWREGHEANVKRVRLALGRRTPGLADQYDYYVEMSENMLISADERDQWALLAKELQGRVVGQQVDPNQQVLF